jgi:two-component system sensor histidine kinase KdpD
MSRPARVAIVWVTAIAAIAAVTAAGRALGLNASTVGFAYLIAVLLISLWGGLLVGAISSIIATLCYNFFFFAPLYMLTLADPANWFALAAFLISSVTVSRLVVAARVQAASAEQRRNELGTLYGLSVDLFAATSRVGALGEAAGRALELLGARGGGLVLSDQTIFWNGEKPDDLDAVIDRVIRSGQILELPSPLGRDIYLPLVLGGKPIGVLVARGTEASMHALESAARLVALSVERQRLVEESAHLEALRESEALKTSLLRAISHDLTTPITAININMEALRRRAAGDAELRDVAGAIADETERLRRRIDNLLSMARLEAGRARPRSEPTPPADLFRAARENLAQVFAARPVRAHVDADCPDANVDPSLALEILVNLLENAHRVSTPGEPVELTARRHPTEPDMLRIEVLDRGPGLPAGIADADVAQRGLGLEIARSLAAANGGSVSLAPRAGGGTVARIDLPAAPLPVEARA